MKGVFVVIEEYVDLLTAYGSAAILDGSFAYAFYVKDSAWRIDGPIAAIVTPSSAMAPLAV